MNTHFLKHKKRLSRILMYTVLSLTTAYCSMNDDLYNLSFNNVQENYFLLDSSSLNMIVISDWGFNGSANQLAVAAEMEHVSKLAGIEFILTCGDNFQIAGVKSTSDILWNTNFERVYSDSSLSVPWYPALGNHDYMGNPSAQVEYSAINNMWNMPERYYTFVKDVNANTQVRIIVLDTPNLIESFAEVSDPEEYETIEQYAWLKSVLASAHEEWIIVTGHHPVFSASTFHGDTREMNILVKPLLEQYKVDYYLCGHDHHFEHAREADNYTEYIVTGTGGDVRPVGLSFRTEFSLTSLGFTYISISPAFSKLCFITENGQVAYQHYKFK